MLIDLAIVAISLLAIILVIPSEEKDWRIRVIQKISQNAIMSGMIVSIIQIIIILSKLERLITQTDTLSSVSLINFTMMILIRFRPLLIGVVLRLIALLILKICAPNQTLPQQETPLNKELQEKISLLSRREKEVAKLAAHGYSNAQIAQELFISVETVKKHLYVIFEKLGIDSRKDLPEKL